MSLKNIPNILFCTGILLIPIGFTLFMGFNSIISYIIITISCFLMMSLITIITIQLMTYLQSETPIHLTGKVISLVIAFSICSQPIGHSIYGFLFDYLELYQYVITFSTSIACIFIAMLSKKVFIQ